ncbi:MAG: hypothetical protein WBO46_08800, partial [Caldilineaceae bacterium]
VLLWVELRGDLTFFSQAQSAIKRGRRFTQKQLIYADFISVPFSDQHPVKIRTYLIIRLSITNEREGI